MSSGQTKDVVFSLGDLPADQSAKSWFLGIGINNYRHFAVLGNAVKDIQDILAVLDERYELDEKIILLDEEATRDNITNHLENLADKVGPEDRVIIYFSGHGFLKNETGYWIPIDAEPGKRGSLIRNETILGCIKDLSAKHILLISDTCFSGSLVTRDVYNPEVAMEELERDRSRWVLSSGRQTEKVADGSPGGNSPFATSILKVLRDNHSPRLNVGFVADKVVKLTRYNWEQMPQGSPLFGVGHEGGQYVFRLKAGEKEAWAACAKENTIAAYQLFLELYPASEQAGTARAKLTALEEDSAWEAARRENTILAYYRYEQAYPQGRYSLQAFEAIRELEEEQSWQDATRSQKLSAFQKYLIDYPDGKYRTEAGSYIEQIISSQEEPTLWEKTRQLNTVAAYRTYLEKYPDGQNAVEARRQLTELQAEEQAEEGRRQEEIAWKQARKEHTISAYQAFLQQFPRSAFASEAQAAGEELRAEKNRQQQDKRARQQQEEQEKAQERRQKLEQSEWDKASTVNSIPAIRAYLKKHPRGKNAAVARRQLADLQADRQQALIALLKKHARWAAPVLLLLVIFAISKMITGGASDEAEQLRLFQDPVSLKFGYQNADGDTVILAMYEKAKEFVDGMAWVENTDSAFYIDPKGLWVQADPTAMGDPAEMDRNAWLAAGEKKNKEAFQVYLDQFPDGMFSEEARKQIQAIEQAEKDPVTKKAPEPARQQPTQSPSTIQLTGAVSNEEGYPVIFANVLVKGTSIRSTTDIDGKFKLNLPVGKNILVISSVGYETREIAVNGRTNISVTIEILPELKTEGRDYPTSQQETSKSGPLEVKGVVRSAQGEALVGATILIKGASPPIGAVTDFDGNFTLTVPAGMNILEIATFEYGKQEVAIDGRTYISVTMKE